MSSELTALCVSNGDDVTIAVRGKHKIKENIASVKKITFDRLNEAATKSILSGKYFDVVFDCSGYVPQSVDWVLSCIKTKRYIYISSFETYAYYRNGLNIGEDDLPIIGKPYETSINIGEKAWYARGKYHSEILIANKYADINYAIVRIPFVMSLANDYDDELSSRILKYVSAIVKEQPICGKNLDCHYSFVENTDEAKFLFFLSQNSFKGVINFASQGDVTMRNIIQYVENKVGKKAVIDSHNVKAFPFSMHPEITMDLNRCLALPYTPMSLDDWMPQKLDHYIEYCKNDRDKSKIGREKILRWFITGGSTGFGKALVLRLHQLGYTVAAASRDISKLNGLPEDVIKIQLDVRDIDSCNRAVKLAEEKMGGIDVLVNNAGISHISTFEETPDEIGNDIIETNYWGTANMTKAIIPYMRKRRNGTVINMSCSRSFCPRNYGSYYVASKFAVESLTKNMKFECQRFMRFMAVECGGLNTGLNQRQTVIHSQIDEYKQLPALYPLKKGYSNKLDKAVEAVINTANYKELPRDLILGWDAYQQFPQALSVLEKEAEKYKPISVTTDEAKADSVHLEDIVLPRNDSLQIQNWLITGASGGFGRILALRLKELGYTVMVTSRDISKLESFPNEIYRMESQLDSAEECNRVIKAAVEKMGSVDVLVNNATSNCWCSFEECPYDIMRKVFYTNYTLPQQLIKAVLPYMRKARNGTVINISSIAGIQPRARVSTYSAAKAALEGLTRTLKSECRRFARFMAVELVCMRTEIMIHNPVYDPQISDYQKLGRYTQAINNIPNRKDIAAQQIINVANRQELPQSLLIGTESYLIAKDEIKRSRKEFEEYKDTTLSVCEKKELK